MVGMGVPRAPATLLTACLVVACALPAPATPEPTTPIPPRAMLLSPGNPPIEGAVGTYSWDGFASDSPWLAGAGPIRIAPDILASIRFPADAHVGTWEVRYAPVSDGLGDPARAVNQSALSGPEIDFPAPPEGSWSVQVLVEFVGRGRVTYYWRFEVSAALDRPAQSADAPP
jgi:hypothetical protein